jgi:hypothetical protein
MSPLNVAWIGHNIGTKRTGINQTIAYFFFLVTIYTIMIPKGIIVNAGILVNIARPRKIPDIIRVSLVYSL